ncbi:tripartite tricarboxylate transporter TctB family protein [Halorubrum sp. HHNYT27]|uniref:tripartite tricarboxylate transporter TctB family protein n=1 Tax=Halorubrum sp. HHNYT27 TaxID=3402275 RepID=UPI003EBA0EB0
MVQQQLDNVDSEQILLGFLVVVSGAMVIQTFQWNQSSAIFPRYIGLATLIGSVLLLIRNYLPEPFYTVVAGSTSITGGSRETDQVQAKKDEEDQSGGPSTELPDRPLSPAVFTAVLITLYIGLSYLFSMFLMTPLFVIAYTAWFEQPWYMIAFLTGIGTLLAYAFTTVLIVPVDRGVYVGDLLQIGLGGVV